MDGSLSFRVYFPLLAKYNWAVRLVYRFKFLLRRYRTKEIIHSPDKFLCNEYLKRQYCLIKINKVSFLNVNLIVNEKTSQYQRHILICILRASVYWSLSHSYSSGFRVCSWPGYSWNSPGKKTGVDPSLGDLPDLGIKPRSPALWADSLPSEPPGEL